MSYPVCPKCGHAPLPADQSLPAACPACGIVLAKFAAAPTQEEREAESVEEATKTSLGGWLFHVPDEVAKANWYGRIAALVVFAVYTVIIFRDTDIKYGDLGGVFMSKVLLPWHEAGHLIMRPFGEFMTIFGGTLFQHLFPFILGLALLIKRRDPFGCALAFWLFGYSTIYTGWYMHDAGDPQAMMVSGKSSAETDGHDWVNLFSFMGGWWLQHAIGVGISVARAGQAMMVAGLLWGAYMIWAQKERLSDSPFAEAPADRE